MVRTVKAKTSRSLKKGEQAVLVPGTTGAEPWELWLTGAQGVPECIQICETPLDNRWDKKTTLAFPVAEVFCLPLWLNETDAKQFAGIITLQLELRGLQPRGNGAPIFDWSVIAQEGARTLVAVGVLPASLPREMQAEAYDAFDLSARCFAFPENTLTLWREQDRLAIAITRGRNLVYWQSLAEGRITPGLLQDLNCVRATLEMQGILTSLQQVMLWTEVTPAELGTLPATIKLPVHQGERPKPALPPVSWKLIPTVVGHAQKGREVRRRWRQGLLLFFAIYLLAIIVLAMRLWMTSMKVDELNKWQAGHAQAIALVHETRKAWKELRPVVDQDSYPLELLLHVSESIPADQLHLTLFEAGDGHLLLKGEARNVAAAFQFLDKLKKDPHFAGYTWTMGQPQVLPNDLAQLQIEGTRAN